MNKFELIAVVSDKNDLIGLNGFPMVCPYSEENLEAMKKAVINNQFESEKLKQANPRIIKLTEVNQASEECST